MVYIEDIMEYKILGEKRKGVIERYPDGRWVIYNDKIGNNINLFEALKSSWTIKIGNWYENKDLLD